ncbi:cytochrome P450 [Kibdelosporangium persicum]|uniref:Pentalenene oxygenase n=1 Tax=Kibdelosporangium persicum TaxID=2698649 RepID=A0ABX2FI05_9PSEU|nr:cytochrome P450 [Kibdelosporangium persicum]NRN71037.1 Pentalenene oxygenase [Kibdelosporangium persicum]
MIPLAPGGLPLAGHALALLRDSHGFLTSLPAHGDLVRIKLGPSQAVVVCTPELTQRVLREDKVFDKGGALFDRIREWLGDGLGTCAYHRHRRQRRLIQPAFNHTRLPGYGETMTGLIDEVTAGWQDGQVLDMPAEMGTLSARIAVETMFRDALSPDVLRKSVDDVTTIVRGLYLRASAPEVLTKLPLPGNRRQQMARTRLRRIVGDIITERRSAGADHGDLLSALLAARDLAEQGDGQGLSNEEIGDQVLTFFASGLETTALALVWSLRLLSYHPDIEQRVRAEATSVLSGRPAAYDDVSKLDLTGRVVTEVLRLFPPAGEMFTRRVTSDTTLAGHPIAAGTTIVYSSCLIHHRGDLYDNPAAFDPDRWDRQTRTPPPREAFIPFGGGARKCIGDQFALTEVILGLATILSRWQVRPVPMRRDRPKNTTEWRRLGKRMRVTRVK